MSLYVSTLVGYILIGKLLILLYLKARHTLLELSLKFFRQNIGKRKSYLENKLA